MFRHFPLVLVADSFFFFCYNNRETPSIHFIFLIFEVLFCQCTCQKSVRCAWSCSKHYSLSVQHACTPTVITVSECLLSNPCFPLPTNAVKEKRRFFVSLPTLSNQEKELHKEAVLPARGEHTKRWRSVEAKRAASQNREDTYSSFNTSLCPLKSLESLWRR